MEEKIRIQDKRIFRLEEQIADIMYGRSEQLIKMQNSRTETLENDILILKKIVTEHIM
jgi:hypothetical protein